MTKSGILSLLVSVFLLPCIPALGQEIKMSVTVKAVPDAAAKESFQFSGTITGSTLYPKGHLNVSNDVTVTLEYIEPGGKFRTLPTSMNVRYGQRKGKKYLTPEEKSGIKAKGISLFRTGLSAENEGKAIKFDKVLKVPQGAAAYRVVATLTHSWSGTWMAIVYKNDVQTLAILGGKGGEIVKVAATPSEHRPYYTPKIQLFRFKGEEVEVDANGTGEWEEVTQDMLPITIGPNGRVITGFGSEATIDMARRGLVTVKELSNYSVGEFLITDEGITAHTNMKVGEVNVKVDRKYKAIDFTVKCGTCTNSVRGTEFTLSHTESPMKSTVSVYSGKVEVTPNLCSEPAIILAAGQRITVDKNCFGKLEVFDPAAGDEPGKIDDEGDEVLVRLEPVADSHVYAYSYRNWNKANWGKYENLNAGWNPTGGEKRTFLKFDLAGIDPNSVDKATLKLYHYHTGVGNAIDIGVYRIMNPWQEGSGTYHSGQTEKTASDGEISWVNQPKIDQYPVVCFNPGPGIGKWVEVDVTSLVKAWLTGIPNHGMAIKTAANYLGKFESHYAFRSREFEEADKRPSLIIGSGPGGTTGGTTNTGTTGSGTTGGTTSTGTTGGTTTGVGWVGIGLGAGNGTTVDSTWAFAEVYSGSDPNLDYSQSPVWSHDSQHVCFPCPGIWRYDLATGKPKKVISAVPDPVLGLTFDLRNSVYHTKVVNREVIYRAGTHSVVGKGTADIYMTVPLMGGKPKPFLITPYDSLLSLMAVRKTPPGALIINTRKSTWDFTPGLPPNAAGAKTYFVIPREFGMPMALSSDWTKAIAADNTGGARPYPTTLWSVPAGKPLLKFPKSRGLQSFGFSPDGTHIVAVQGQQREAPKIVIIALATPDKVISAVADAGASAYSPPAWSPDGKYLAFISEIPGPIQFGRQQFTRKMHVVRILSPKAAGPGNAFQAKLPIAKAELDDARKKQAYEDYIKAYNHFTSLISQGKKGTVEADVAFKEYKAKKEKYEKLIKEAAGPTEEKPSSLNEAYEKYIAAYKHLTKLVVETPITGPPEMKKLSETYREARDEYNRTQDRNAYQESIAIYNRLTSQSIKIKFTGPENIRRAQEDFFNAKAEYDRLCKQSKK